MTTSLPGSFQPIQKNEVQEQESGLPKSFQPKNESQPEYKEGLGKNILRKIYQPLSGILKKFTWPAELINMVASAGTQQDIDELRERIPELKKKFPTAPWDQFNEEEFFNPEKIAEAQQTASQFNPLTQSGIENIIESSTGAPLTPKTRTDQLLSLGGTAGSFRKGGIGPKLTAGVVAPTSAEALKRHGYPEEAADAIGLFLSQLSPAPSFSAATKPSGMKIRQFEKLEKPTKVSGGRFAKINETLESDFRNQAEKILEENRTYSAMKADSGFRSKIKSVLNDVYEKSGEITDPIKNDVYRKSFKKEYNEYQMKGFAPSEYDKALKKQIRQMSKDTPYEDFSARQSVDQYRKNNDSLGQYFEPGKSGAVNKAKRDAILIQQRAIADAIEKTYPGSEFSKNFQFTNRRWQEMADIEDVNEYLSKIFHEDTSKRINFKAVNDFRDDKFVQRPFKRLLKPEEFKNFETLMDDLGSFEKNYALIKKARDAGYEDLAEKAALYMISSKAAGAKVGFDAYKMVRRMVLDKPQLITTWESGVENFKRGNYSTAGKEFDKLSKELKGASEK